MAVPHRNREQLIIHSLVLALIDVWAIFTVGIGQGKLLAWVILVLSTVGLAWSLVLLMRKASPPQEDAEYHVVRGVWARKKTKRRA